ncbi:uncharacterized protein LOC112574991 isoform X2 [Pomacea canaliculata]|uniref:uncharacterized protein LOC112574991 isoform X2 n=1 Tax=Pomacea canaliculata TaxID=400727 RepID=UPI000D73E567|nr:uncharacterized protein LOC112574991 isoform X2 [Pomacea canaliculata]
MEAYTGTWELVKEESTGVEEFIEAYDMPDMEKKRLRHSSSTLTYRRDGDQWFVDSVSGDRTDTMELCLGKEYSYEFGSSEAKATATIENGKIVGTHTSKDKVIKSVSYITGDRLIMEITANGVTMVTKYKRQS